MHDAIPESLADLVAQVQKTVGEARQSGDPIAILAAANAGADSIERRVEKLSLGHLQQGTARWLSGAFELALGRLADASSAFSVARQHYLAAEAPGLVLLMEGYEAIAARMGAQPGSSVAKDDLEEIYARITAGGFEDGPEWIEQLRTALKVFT
jgi:hypothetical protein